MTNVIEATQDQDSRIEAQSKAKQNKGEKRRLGREREAQDGNSDQKSAGWDDFEKETDTGFNGSVLCDGPSIMGQGRGSESEMAPKEWRSGLSVDA